MKHKTSASLLALFLWWIWVHKFYLGKHGRWVAYLLLCRTFIPAVIGVIEAIQLYRMDEKTFNEKYNEWNHVPQVWLLTDRDKKQLKPLLKWWWIIVWGMLLLFIVLWLTWNLEYSEEELAQMEQERLQKEEQARIDERRRNIPITVVKEEDYSYAWCHRMWYYAIVPNDTNPDDLEYIVQKVYNTKKNTAERISVFIYFEAQKEKIGGTIYASRALDEQNCDKRRKVAFDVNNLENTAFWFPELEHLIK